MAKRSHQKKYTAEAQIADKRYALKQPQESVDFICEQLGQMTSRRQVILAVAEKFDLSESGARGRVESVWRHLERSAGTSRKIDRERLSQALKRVMRDAMRSADLKHVLEMLYDNGVDSDEWKDILSKWDPHKCWATMLKAADQYAKLHGLNAPDQLEVRHDVDAEPLALTQQERQERIAALAAKGGLKIPTGENQALRGCAATNAEKRANKPN